MFAKFGLWRCKIIHIWLTRIFAQRYPNRKSFDFFHEYGNKTADLTMCLSCAANNPCVLSMVTTEGVSPSIVSAGTKVRFVPCTPDILHQDRSHSSAEVRRVESAYSSVEPKLVANNCSIVDVPSLVANITPLSVVGNLYSTLVWTGRSHKTNRQISYKNP